MNWHTSGPWAFRDDYRLVVGPADDPVGDPVAEIVGHPEQAFPNAILIAAAPEMLECLTECIALMEQMQQTPGVRIPTGLAFCIDSAIKAGRELIENKLSTERSSQI